ncbi:uncharacterized protein LOC112565266 [Pomacea canaliculata]|uniref:uncharacterized protein LOC112565266 n=1 Tax=Pomacea canaliculata TaxID=400727 RepID=UPI000D7338AF|nr:uncharacterized protein LOC112565266 [Pomacea canaliculata]
MKMGYCLLGALSLVCLLLAITVVPVSSRPMREVTCEAGWTPLAGACWMAMPELIFAQGVDVAETFCQMQNSKLYFSDSAALCFKTGNSNYDSVGQMETAIKKRVMGNIGF